MKVQQYYNASSLEEAYQMLLLSNKNMIIAGGAWLKLSVKSVDTLLGLEHLGLDEIVENKAQIEIGSMVPLRQIETNPALIELASGILPFAIHNVMGVPIRNVATLGGTVMGKYGFSDILTALLVMNARLVFYHLGEVSLEEHLNSSRKDKDILLKIIIPKSKMSGFFKKVAITALDFAIINVALSYSSDKIMISVGARPALASLAKEAMAYFNSQSNITDDVIETCANIVINELSFGSNSRSSAEYRKNLAKVYISRGLKEVTSYEN
ncbi:MAG: FAD binding domain-containing protein [Firmicutes bacterium]|nr:FAD binding domain-containing protein [Bacillota bacterium]